MASREEVFSILEMLHKNRPFHAFDKVHENEVGIFGVLNFLKENKTEIKSKDISDALGISSARMAVLLKKMDTKGLIEKSISKTDARVTVVSLTEKGEEISEKIKANVHQTVEKLIDEFGVEKLEQTLCDMMKIKNILENNKKNFLEEYND